MEKEILEIIKQHDLHDISISISDDNAKTEPKLTLKLRHDDTDHFASKLKDLIQVYNEAREFLDKPKSELSPTGKTE